MSGTSSQAEALKRAPVGTVFKDKNAPGWQVTKTQSLDGQISYRQEYINPQGISTRAPTFVKDPNAFNNTQLATPAGQEKGSSKKPAKKPATKTAQKSAASSPKTEKPTPEPGVVYGKEVNADTGNAFQGTVAQAAGSQTWDIARFRSQVQGFDILPNHSYLVTFAPFRLGYNETAALNDIIDLPEMLTLRCETVSLPSVSFFEEDAMRRYGYGPVEKIPYGVQFGDLSMVFALDSMSSQSQFFYQWMNTIVAYESQGGYMRNKNKQQRRGLNEYSPYEVGYKEAYTCPVVRVSVYNKMNELVQIHEFYDVYPLAIDGNSMSWNDVDQHQRLQVRFSFVDMSSESPEAIKYLKQNADVNNSLVQLQAQNAEVLSNLELQSATRSAELQDQWGNEPLVISGRSYGSTKPSISPTVATTVGSSLPAQSIIKGTDGTVMNG